MAEGADKPRKIPPLGAAALWMLLAPLHKPLKGYSSPVFRSWMMFSGIGVSVNDAKFFRQLGPGE